ncbi:hypothetical protein D3C87_1258630 [compost metagenome]
MRQRANLFGHHRKPTAHFSGTGRFDGGVKGQQIGLVGNRANHRQHATDGGRFLGQVFDHLRVALHFTHQFMQPGEAQADDFLPVLHRQSGMSTGVGGLAGIAGDLLNGRLQFAEGIADHRGIAGLMLGAAVQVVAQLRQGAAAAGDLLGVEANGAHQIHQISPQAIERGLNVMQFAIGLAQFNVLAEVALGPGRQGRRQIGQGPGQASLQGIDQQRDQQDQADHYPLHQSHFALDLPVLGTDHRFQPGDGLLHGGDFQVSGGAEVGALANLFAGAGKFRRIAGQQVIEFTLEADTSIFGDRFLGVLQAHHGGEIIGVRLTVGGDAQQWQGLQLFGLNAQVADFTLDIGGQFAATAADQFVPGQRQFAQVLGRGEQWRLVSRIGAGVLAELIKAGRQFAFGLQQQRLWIAREFTGSQQVGFAEFIQIRQARAQGIGQCRRQLAQFLSQAVDGLAGAAQAQRIAAGKVILDVARDVILKLPGQAQVALHQ